MSESLTLRDEHNALVNLNLELLEALRRAQDISAEMTRSGRESTLGLRLYDAVHPAITKATGDPNDWGNRQAIARGDA